MSEEQTIVNREKYIQAPLCLLAYPGSLYDIITGMLYIGIHRARLFLSENPEHHYELPDNMNLPEDFDNNNREHQLLCTAAWMSGLILHSIVNDEKQIRKYQEFIDDFESEFGTDALVRHKTDVCFDVRDNGALNPREFSILSAIYSCLGQSSCRRITSAEIQCRATGYRSKEIFDTFEERPEPLFNKASTKDCRRSFFKWFFWKIYLSATIHLLFSQT